MGIDPFENYLPSNFVHVKRPPTFDLFKDLKGKSSENDSDEEDICEAIIKAKVQLDNDTKILLNNSDSEGEIFDDERAKNRKDNCDKIVFPSTLQAIDSTPSKSKVAGSQTQRPKLNKDLGLKDSKKVITKRKKKKGFNMK